MMALALATQTSLYPAILLVPLLLVLRTLPGSSTQKTGVYTLVFVFAATLAALAGLATWACTDSWIKQTWGVM